MCDLGLVLGLASSMMSAIGQAQAADNAAAEAEYQAQIYEMNAKIADRNARQEFERGRLDEQEVRQKTTFAVAQQRARMAAAGVDVAFGSPLDTLVGAKMMGELDALSLRMDVGDRAYGHKVDATNKRAQSSLLQFKAANKRSQGNLSAFGTMIGGFGKLAKGLKTASSK